MKIELIKETEVIKNGKNKYEEKVIKKDTFYSKRPRGAVFQKMLLVNKTLENMGEEMTEYELNLIAEFICQAFGDQFTVEEFLDGVYTEDIFPLYQNVCEEITKKLALKMNNVAKK